MSTEESDGGDEKASSFILHTVVYDESYTWPLTSATKCYSAARKTVADDDGATLRAHLATELHVVEVELSHGTDDATENVLWKDVAGSSSTGKQHYACVGYSKLGSWEAMVVMDQSSAQALHGEQQGQPQQPDTGNRETTQSDDISTSASPDNNPQHRRTPSSVSAETIATQSLPSLSDVAPIMTATPRTAGRPLSKLFLYHNETTYMAPLDFRPLAPTLCGISERVGVWLGSADHNKLQFWQPDTTTNTNVLRCVDLHDAAFQFESPVMALDCLQLSDGTFLLAVACQDGTVRLIALGLVAGTAQTLLPSSVSETTVIIDGPIVCISLQQLNERINVCIGSLCGYVCEMWCNSSSVSTGAWEGPHMVAEGFWNNRLQTEDSVLAVHAAEGRVAVGTHGGRCKVYQKVDDVYERHWECQLPYPVHGIILLSLPSRLLVTTRRSIHLFRGRPQLYDADLAKRRIEQMMRELAIRKATQARKAEESEPKQESHRSTPQASSPTETSLSPTQTPNNDDVTKAVHEETNTDA